MFSENLKKLRLKKGYSQKELADQLNVVRQTVSKWENGLSVPDALLLDKMAKVLDTQVNVLLGETFSDEINQKEVALQLERINEQLVIKNRRRKKVWKVVSIILLVIVILNVLLVLLNVAVFEETSNTSETTEVVIDGEKYNCKIVDDC